MWKTKTNKIIETLKLNDAALDKKVKIQGTPYDRKCKFSSKTLSEMLYLANVEQKSYIEIAKELGYNPTAVRYRIDPEFKQEYNSRRNGKHTGKDHISIANRVAYKRDLVASGKII